MDNDIQRSAEGVCSSANLPWRLKYVVEPVRGISQARNRAVQEGSESEFIAFVDDAGGLPLWI